MALTRSARDVQKGGISRTIGRRIRKAATKWLLGMLAPLALPIALVLGTSLLVMAGLGAMTNAGASPEAQASKPRYEAAARAVDPPGIEDDLRLDWGILAACELFSGRTGKTGELARRLAPQVEYSDYDVTVTKALPDGTETQETVSFRLVSEVRTYNAVYRYGYAFREEGGEVVPERTERVRTVDRSRLEEALSWLMGERADPFMAQVAEQTALSYDTGKVSLFWLSSSLGGRTVTWPVAGRVTSEYGWRLSPVSGAPEMHPGIDIAAEEGTAVPAVASGTVDTAGWNGGYGLCVVLSHPDGRQTLYGHLSQVLVGPGQAVAAGQAVGLVGSTGESTGPHLHFEVREGGIPVDPSAWVR